MKKSLALAILSLSVSCAVDVESPSINRFPDSPVQIIDCIEVCGCDENGEISCVEVGHWGCLEVCGCTPDGEMACVIPSAVVTD